jgi:EmrB/QacA subfamily drug resistance transporter
MGTRSDTGPTAAAGARADGQGRARLVLPLAAGAAFLAMLDATVTNLAVPDLARDFSGTSVTSLSWVITAYFVAFAAALTPAGRLADVVGRRLLFVCGVCAFTLMSLACALAPNLPSLVTARALQGVGAAAMIPASLALVLHGAPPERRAHAVGLWSASGALAAAVGPSVGGLLVEAFGWRSLFVVNVPVGVAMVALTWVVPRAAGRSGGLPDLVGTLLLGAGLGAVVLGVSEASTWGWSDPETLSCLAGGALALALAVRRAFRHPVPAVETGLWRTRTFAVANVVSLLYGAVLYAWLLTGVLYVTEVWGYSELRAGLAMSPGAVAAAVTAAGSGRLVARVGLRTTTIAGFLCITAVGVWMVAWLPSTPHFLALWLPAGTLVGIGMGAVTTGTATAAALSVPPPRFAAATGMNTAARQVGGALGIAVLAAIQEAGDGMARFGDVYLTCLLLCVVASGVALALVLPSRPSTPDTASGGPAAGTAPVAAGARGTGAGA